MTDPLDEAIKSADTPKRVEGSFDLGIRRNRKRTVALNLPDDLTVDDVLELSGMIALYLLPYLEAHRQSTGGLVVAKTMPGRMT